MTKDEAMRIALEAFEALYINDYDGYEISKHEAHVVDDAITALRQALEQPEPEPVAWMSDSQTKGNGRQLHWTKSVAWRWSSNITPLYTAPPKREWVGLTDEERKQFSQWAHIDVVEDIETTLRDKNGF